MTQGSSLRIGATEAEPPVLTWVVFPPLLGACAAHSDPGNTLGWEGLGTRQPNNPAFPTPSTPKPLDYL